MELSLRGKTGPLCKWFAMGLGMRLGNLSQKAEGMEDQLPNSQASVASGPAGTACLWILEADTKEWCQKQGLGLPPGSSESSGNAGRESKQAPAKGSQVKVLILFLFLASCPLASSSPVSYLFALIFSAESKKRAFSTCSTHQCWYPVLLHRVLYLYPAHCGICWTPVQGYEHFVYHSSLNPLIYTREKRNSRQPLKKI